MSAEWRPRGTETQKAAVFITQVFPFCLQHSISNESCASNKGGCYGKRMACHNNLLWLEQYVV